MLKKLLILLIAMAPVALMAQEMKVATINVQEVFSKMPELSDIETQLNNKQEKISKDIQALREEYNKKMEEFENNPATSEASRQDQIKQLSQLQERYDTYLQNGQQEFGQLQQQLIEPVNRKIMDAIKAVGDENKFVFVYDISSAQSPFMYITPSAVDITAQVKTKLGI